MVHNQSDSVQGKKLWLLFAGTLCGAFLANCFTPLRLTTDTIRYFELTERLNGIWPADLPIRNDFLPYGYVILLTALSKLKILSSFTICLGNSLYLAGSAWFVTNIFSASVKKIQLIIFILLSWITIKQFVLPLSEMQFLFFTTGSLWYFQQYGTSKKIKHLLLSAIFCSISILTRTAGVALLAALLISFFITNRKQISQWIRQKIAYSIIVLAVIIIPVVFLVTSSKFQEYIEFFTRPLTNDPASFFATNIKRHMVDWAELFINIPYSKASLYYPSTTWMLYIIIGIISLAVLVRLVFLKRISIPIPVKVYIIAYLLLIFNWPFYEARFWFPILPLLAGVMLQQTIYATAINKNLAGLYKFYFIAAGICALGYYSWLSFNKSALATKQEEGIFRIEYEKHFFDKPVHDSVVNKKALYILEKYD